jgi:hypothetical protein
MKVRYIAELEADPNDDNTSVISSCEAAVTPSTKWDGIKMRVHLLDMRRKMLPYNNGRCIAGHLRGDRLHQSRSCCQKAKGALAWSCLEVASSASTGWGRDTHRARFQARQRPKGQSFVHLGTEIFT